MTDSQRHLLILAHSGSQGGAELCLDTTLRHLDRSRYRATVLFPWEGPMVDSARAMGYAVELLPLAAWMLYDRCVWQYKNAFLAGPARVANLVRRIRHERIDLVYSNTAVIYEGALAARLAGVPHVWHVHEVLTAEHMAPRMLPLAWITRQIGRWSDRVIFESQAARQIVGPRIPPERSEVIHNSCRFLSADPREAAAAGPQRPGPVVVWVGRFSERKNPRLLLEALTRVRQPVSALLVGDGPLKSAVCREIHERGLDAVCHILPFQEDLRPILAAADLLVLTSREESFGLVLVEAGACGKPVVATRSQGPAEIIQEGHTGFLVDRDDAAALAARIDQLAANPALRHEMGEAAARHVAAEFSPEANTRKLEAVFDRLLPA